ncbi:MAG: hypothetical protein JXA33_28655 [Anaerolineae bacterium]|nr:hypothetical protein [Anaerolineae bacterium]
MKLLNTMRRVGWLAFGLMWIFFITLMVSLIGMPGGDYAWSELPPLTRFSLVGVGGLFLMSITLLVSAPIIGGLSNRATLARGLPAEAIILKLSDTGTTINNNPIVRLLLEVHLPGQSPFQAETEQLFSQLQIPQIQPGTTVQVKYNPTNQAVALVDQ